MAASSFPIANLVLDDRAGCVVAIAELRSPADLPRSCASVSTEAAKSLLQEEFSRSRDDPPLSRVDWRANPLAIEWFGRQQGHRALVREWPPSCARQKGYPEKVQKAVDRRFAQVDKRFERLDERLTQMATREEMNEGFAEMRSAYTALTRTLLVGAIAIVAALIGIVGALVVS